MHKIKTPVKRIIAVVSLLATTAFNPTPTLAATFVTNSQASWNSAVLTAEMNGEDDTFRIDYSAFTPTTTDLEYLSKHREIDRKVAMFDQITGERTEVLLGMPKLIISNNGGCTSRTLGHIAYWLDVINGGGLFNTATAEYNAATKVFWDSDPAIPDSITAQTASNLHHNLFELPDDTGGPVIADTSGPKENQVWHDPRNYGGDTSIASLINESLSVVGAGKGGSVHSLVKPGMLAWGEEKDVNLRIKIYTRGDYVTQDPEEFTNLSIEDLWEIITNSNLPILLGLPGHSTAIVGFSQSEGRKSVATLGSYSFDVLWRDFEGLNPQALTTFEILHCADHPEVCTQAECGDEGWNWCENKRRCYVGECPSFNWNLFLPAITDGRTK